MVNVKVKGFDSLAEKLPITFKYTHVLYFSNIFAVQALQARVLYRIFAIEIYFKISNATERNKPKRNFSSKYVAQTRDKI